MIQKMTNKLVNRKKDNKGFTLVELIVVIVILAILAAILIPGLLRWIDKAKEEQYVLEARNVYLATEGEIATLYAGGNTVKAVSEALAKDTSKSNIGDLADVTINTLEVTLRGGTAEITTPRNNYDITKLHVIFVSSSGTIDATLENGTWTAKKTS